MKKINILCGDEVKFNNYLFSHWSIVIESIDFLQDYGYKIEFFKYESEKIFDCDFLFLSSRYFFKEKSNLELILRKLNFFKEKNKDLVWFDFRDSAGTTQFEVLPFVKIYVKGQYYKNLDNYKNLLYGGRLYTDYYHNTFNIKDQNKYEMTALDEKYKNKLKLGWNLGVMRYDIIYKFSKFNKLIIYLSNINNLKKAKPNFDYQKTYNNKKYRFFAVFNSIFKRSTVAYQRKLALKKLKYFNNEFDLYNVKLRKNEYLNKLRNSKAVLSCFGWGEICYRDWESVINRIPLIKPDMSDIITWPNIYLKNESYYSVKWDFSDLEEALDNIINNEKTTNKILNTALNIHYSIRENNNVNFCKQFGSLLN